MRAETIFRLRTPILLCIGVIVILAGTGIPHLRFNSDTRVFFDPTDQRMANLKSFERTFQPTRKVLFAVHSDNPIEDDRTKQDAIRWLSDQLGRFPYIVRTDSIETVSYPFDDGTEIVVEPYLDFICPSKCLEERVTVLSDPMVERRLVSPDRHTVSAIGIFDVERDSGSKLAEVARHTSDLRAAFADRYPSLGIYATGGIPVSQAYVRAGQRDASTLFVVSACLILLVIRVILGDFRNTAIMLTTGLFAVVICMGIGGWLGVVLNSNWRVGLNALLAITIPVACGLGAWGWMTESIGLAATIIIAISLGVVIDDAIHLIYQQFRASKRVASPWESTAYSVHRVGAAIVATTFVFVIGLGPLLFSDFQINVTFAACASLILVLSLAFDLAILPKLMAWSQVDRR